MSFYNDQQIKTAIGEGRILCHPFNEDQVSGNKLSLTLGYHYYRVEPSNGRNFFNPFDAEDVERYYAGPYKAMPHGDWCKLNGVAPLKNIPGTHPVISLKPGERIIAHTHEFLGAEDPVNYDIQSHPNFSSNGMLVEAALDEGANRLALAITNLNDREAILLPVGEPIVTVGFTSTGESGNASSVDLDSVIKVWSPDMILPKAFLKQRQLPPQIKGAQYE